MFYIPDVKPVITHWQVGAEGGRRRYVSGTWGFPWTSSVSCELTCGGCAGQVILLPSMYLTGQTSAALSCCVLGFGLFVCLFSSGLHVSVLSGWREVPSEQGLVWQREFGASVEAVKVSMCTGAAASEVQFCLLVKWRLHQTWTRGASPLIKAVVTANMPETAGLHKSGRCIHPA